MKRAYKYRFCPTEDHKRQPAATFGCVRYVYNRDLAERSRAWTQERRVPHAETNKVLTGWKRNPDTAWLTEPSQGPLPDGAVPSLYTLSTRPVRENQVIAIEDLGVRDMVRNRKLA
ncbi:helix-turn-helix domain-containing protein [Nocardia brevicatena]|uniref:helix-turn-helix domain-containing protein n=1 Tax=Nocardia brevicatena TaxID=37327 RepID=UPI000305C216|nr:helix-turn-helix domain-containing protein [Nocardia brevicatena]